MLSQSDCSVQTVHEWTTKLVHIAIRGIHQVTMIHIIYTLIGAIFSKVVYMSPDIDNVAMSLYDIMVYIYVTEVVYMRYIQPAPA